MKFLVIDLQQNWFTILSILFNCFLRFGYLKKKNSFSLFGWENIFLAFFYSFILECLKHKLRVMSYSSGLPPMTSRSLSPWICNESVSRAAYHHRSFTTAVWSSWRKMGRVVAEVADRVERPSQLVAWRSGYVVLLLVNGGSCFVMLCGGASWCWWGSGFIAARKKEEDRGWTPVT